MIGISLNFPAGRYHATPWGRHVNEGAVEWPPSPWRLLRSLVAVWKRTLPDEPQFAVEPILRALAAAPAFALPPASTGHTRHYMPWEKGWKADEPGKAKTKVFDAFVALDPGSAIVACWPDVNLEISQRELLARLLANLNFLGRAESWCEALLLDDAEAIVFGDSATCAALAEGETPLPNDELVRTLCPDPATAFADDHVIEVEAIAQGSGRNKTTTQVRRAVYEPNWHLCIETLRLHDQKWSDPPGSIWVSYTRPRDCFEIKPARRARRPSSNPCPQVFRFSLDSAVLPLVTDMLPVAEAARAAVIRRLVDARGRSRYGAEWSRERHMTGEHPVSLGGAITGKNAAGRPSTGHSHAYYLPTDEDGDGRLDHITVIAAGGFDGDERRAIASLRSIHSRDRAESGHMLRTLLLSEGTLDDTPGPFALASVFVSASPFIAPRHLKRRGVKRDAADLRDDPVAFLAAVLREELLRLIERRTDMRGISVADISIAPLADTHGVFRIARRGNDQHPLRPIQFKRCRNKRSDDGGRRLAGSFRLTFPRPIHGPVALGHSSHFGMGLFLPTDLG